MSTVMFARNSGETKPAWKWNGDSWSTIHFKQHPSSRPTSSPGWNEDQHENSPNMSVILLGITVSAIIVIVIIFIIRCINYVYGNRGRCSGDGSSLTSTTSHVPMRSNEHRPPTPYPYRSAPNSREQQFRTHSSEFYSPSLYQENFSRTGGMQNSVPRISDFAVSSSDKPPDYSMVIISDLNQKNKFPGVHPAQKLDLPPPKYEYASLKF